MSASLHERARQATTAIISGALRGAMLLDMIRAVSTSEREAWVDAVLGIEAPPPDEELPRGAVPYLPCSVDDVLDLVGALALHQPRATLFVDLGSGLGRVVLLVHLLTGMRARGIEIQASLVARARAIAHALSIDVQLDQADVSAIDLAASTGDGETRPHVIYFLYAPFNGALLARVVAQLRAVAHQAPMIVATVGLPLDVPWLSPRVLDTAASSQLAIYDSCVPA